MKFINSKTFFVLAFLLLLGFTGSIVWQSVYSQDADRISIENKTSSLLVESIEQTDLEDKQTLIELTLRNNYQKDIIAVRFRDIGTLDHKDSMSATERGGLGISWVLQPNESYKQRVFVNSEGKVRLIISAVIFEDGTGNGNPKDLLTLQETYEGVHMAFRRISPILQEIANSDTNFLSDEILQSVGKRIKGLDEKDIPSNLKHGFRLAKNYIVMIVEDTKTNKNSKGNFNSKTKIIDTLEKIEVGLVKFSSKLSTTYDNKQEDK